MGTSGYHSTLNMGVVHLGKGAHYVLSYCLGKPPCWQFHLKTMSSDLRISTRACQRYISELITVGYCIRFYEKSGTLRSYVHYMFFATIGQCEHYIEHELDAVLNTGFTAEHKHNFPSKKAASKASAKSVSRRAKIRPAADWRPYKEVSSLIPLLKSYQEGTKKEEEAAAPSFPIDDNTSEPEMKEDSLQVEACTDAFCDVTAEISESKPPVAPSDPIERSPRPGMCLTEPLVVDDVEFKELSAFWKTVRCDIRYAMLARWVRKFDEQHVLQTFQLLIKSMKIQRIYVQEAWMESALQKGWAVTEQRVAVNRALAEKLKEAHNLRSFDLLSWYCIDRENGNDFRYKMDSHEFEQALYRNFRLQ